MMTRYEFIQTYFKGFHQKHTIYYQLADQFTVSQVQVLEQSLIPSMQCKWVPGAQEIVLKKQNPKAEQ